MNRDTKEFSETMGKVICWHQCQPEKLALLSSRSCHANPKGNMDTLKTIGGIIAFVAFFLYVCAELNIR